MRVTGAKNTSGYCAARSCRAVVLIYGVRPNMIPVSTSTGFPSRRYRLNLHCCRASVMALAWSGNALRKWMCFTLPSLSMMIRTGTELNLRSVKNRINP